VRAERAEAERAAKQAAGRRKAKAREAVAAPAPAREEGNGARPASKNQRRRAERLEADIEAAESALHALEAELADPGAWNDPRTAAKSTRRHEEARTRLEQLYAQWEAIAP
jgi:ATP-binding cassette subfamily F protein 3